MQGITNTQSYQLLKKICGMTNPNLLLNAWFVANEGSSATEGSGYCANKWTGSNVTYSTIGITASAANATIVQVLDSKLKTGLASVRICASVKLSNGTIETGSAVYSASGVTLYSSTNTTAAINSSGNLKITIKASGTTVSAVKLEVGYVSTLSNDKQPVRQIEIIKAGVTTGNTLATATTS